MKIGQYLAKIWTSGSGLLFFGPPCKWNFHVTMSEELRKLEQKAIIAGFEKLLLGGVEGSCLGMEVGSP